MITLGSAYGITVWRWLANRCGAYQYQFGACLSANNRRKQ
jgi:hypothetical protein